MKPLLNIWRAYRRYGVGGAWALVRFYAAKVQALLVGPGRQCPICDWSGPEFHPAVYPAHGLWRSKAVCPSCGSFERHRALWFVYQDFFASRLTRPRILHFTPERCFRKLFEAHASQYVTSNYDHELSDVRLDLVNLGLRDATFDVVIANGVLTSVPNHSQAVENLSRVLAPGGSALVCDLMEPEGVLTELADNAMAVRRHYGAVDLQRTFGPFKAVLHDIRSFVPVSDHERFGIRKDDFYLIRLDKPVA
jgi:SAM-dependent methyltransferase